MSVFLLKLIAMVSMFIDHFAFWLANNNTAMRNIGRLAFFIYAFLIAESYYHLKGKPDRLRNHLIKLLVLCVISEPLYDFFEHVKWYYPVSQSVMPTLTLGFIALIGSGWWYRKTVGKRIISIAGCVWICFSVTMASFILKSDYAFCGVVLIVMFYLYLIYVDKMTVGKRLISLLVIEVIYILIDLWARTDFGSWQEFTDMANLLSMWKYGAMVAMVPFVLYNRKLGYHSKWFGWLYSVFYPLQFIVLIFARYSLRGF